MSHELTFLMLSVIVNSGLVSHQGGEGSRVRKPSEILAPLASVVFGLLVPPAPYPGRKSSSKPNLP